MARRSFTRRAASRAAPSTSAQRGRGTPLRRNTETRVVSTASWAPWKSCNQSTKISTRRSSMLFGMAMSISWIRMLVVALPPASLHTRAAADSTEKPRLPRTPATAHAARWWPQKSSGRPHRQTRLDEGRGSQRRRRRRMRNVWASKVECLAIGQLVYSPWDHFGNTEGPGIGLATLPGRLRGTVNSHSMSPHTATHVEELRNPRRTVVEVAGLLPMPPTAEHQTQACHGLT